MDNEGLRSAINEIRDAQNDHIKSQLDYWIGSEWLWGLVSRAVFLTGGDKPLFSDVDLRDKEGPVGSIVVITEKAIVRVTFAEPDRNGPEFSHTVVAERVPLSAVQRVSVEHASSSAQQDANWPLRARAVLHLDRALAGTDRITLPQQEVAHGERAVALLAMASAIS